MNKTMNEKNKKTIRKMNKYINTFPLDDQQSFRFSRILKGWHRKRRNVKNHWNRL